MNNIIKVCRIHGELTLEKTYYRKNRNQYECRQCMRDCEKRRPKRIYEGEFAAYHRNYAKKWRIDNADEVNRRIREDRKSNPEKYREWEKNYRNKNIDKSRYKDVLNKHKISSESYLEMIRMQNNKCAICNQEETRKARVEGISRLCIDHCHSTGNIRGLLCHHCNTGLGKFKDSIPLLQSAIQYLQSHQHKEIA